jgi:hypothetical protein
MKKKITLIALCAVAVLQSASAQRFGIGLEAGTTGVGAELAVTIGNNLAVRGGFTFLPYTYKDTYAVDLDENWTRQMDEAIGDNQQIRDALAAKGLPTSSGELNTNLDLSVKSGLLNGKLLLDYYPWKSYSFHLTGGVYYGKDHLANATTALPDETRQVIDVLQEYKDITGFDFNDETVLEGYDVRPLDVDGLEVKVETAKLKTLSWTWFRTGSPQGSHRLLL